MKAPIPTTTASFILLVLGSLTVPTFSLPTTSTPPPISPNTLPHPPRNLLPLPLLTSTLSDLLSTDLLGDIIRGITSNPIIETSFPGLTSLLQLLKADKEHAGPTSYDTESHLRGLLGTVQGHESYLNALDALDPGLREKVVQFLSGEGAGKVVRKRSDGPEGPGEFHVPLSPAAKHHFQAMEGNLPPSPSPSSSSSLARRLINAIRQTTPLIYEDAQRTKPMKAHLSTPFTNWGLTVHNTPQLTFVPSTVLGLSNLVKYAKAQGRRVRASGYRHTWTDMFSEDGEVLVSLLDLEIATAVPDPSSLLPSVPPGGNEFKGIEVLDAEVGGDGRKRWVKVGAAVTNEELRRWAVGGDEWSLAVNVIMVEITIGGSNAPICHGAGLRHKTLSDLVRAISYIDAHGNPQTVDTSQPELLKAAAGAFGLLGIVTHVTFEFDRMSYAVMRPLKQDVMLAIPPPVGYPVPEGLRGRLLGKLGLEGLGGVGGVAGVAGLVDAGGDGEKEKKVLEEARREFVRKAEESYFSEWFWFPYQDEVFVNCWDTTTDRTGVTDYPTPPDVFLQWLQGWLGGILNDDPLWRTLPGLWQATIFGTLAHLSQPPQGPGINSEILTHLPNALHFRRGIQNMRVRDMELQIPIPPRADDPSTPDYAVVQRAWWDAIALAYADVKAPMRIALELRIMGGSGVVLAPQRGNDRDGDGVGGGRSFGTASIEVVTSMAAGDDGSWAGYMQRLADQWMGLRDGNGGKLNVRPHWAKEWDGLTVEVDGDGGVGGKTRVDWRRYLREVSYKKEIPEFLERLGRIGQAQGWTVDEARERFSVGLLDEVIFGVEDRARKVGNLN